MHKIFISYHHANDQYYKESLVNYGREHGLFVDRSVDTGSISDHLDDQQIRRIIRDDYLQDSTITIVLIGTETKRRKHVDWEIHSSMFDGSVNKKSGILGINLPTIDNDAILLPFGNEAKSIVAPDISYWRTITDREDYERSYPYAPARIIDSLVIGSEIPIVGWNRLTPRRLYYLLERVFANRKNCKYDLSTPMRRRNS